MPSLFCLCRVQPADIGEAIAKALEYRNKLPVVWLVYDSRHDTIRVCQPAVAGVNYDTAGAEVWELSVYGAEYAEPYMQLVFSPGVLPKLEESTWLKRKRALCESKARRSPGASSVNRAGR